MQRSPGCRVLAAPPAGLSRARFQPLACGAQRRARAQSEATHLLNAGRKEERMTMQTKPVPGSLADLHHRFYGDAPGLRDMYRTLQTQCPVLHDQEAGCWLVLRCGDVGSVLTDPATFASSRSGASPMRPPGTLAG